MEQDHLGRLIYQIDLGGAAERLDPLTPWRTSGKDPHVSSAVYRLVLPSEHEGLQAASRYSHWGELYPSEEDDLLWGRRQEHCGSTHNEEWALEDQLEVEQL